MNAYKDARQKLGGIWAVCNPAKDFPLKFLHSPPRLFKAALLRPCSFAPRGEWKKLSGPFCPNPRSVMTTRVFTTTQILLGRLSMNGLTSLCCLYHRGYKIVYLEVVVLQSVEYSVAMYSPRAKWATYSSPLAPFRERKWRLQRPRSGSKYR